MNIERKVNDKKCPKCAISFDRCFCHLLSNINSEVRVSMVMHHAERFLASNTAFLVQRVLANSTIHIRGVPEKKFNPVDVLISNCDHLYLFPYDDAISLDDYIKQRRTKIIQKPMQLIVPDGSWRQARKIRNREDWGENLVNVKLPTLERTSRYLLRKQHRHDGLSTFEAISEALQILDPNFDYPKMNEQLEIMVHHFVEGRNTFRKSNPISIDLKKEI